MYPINENPIELSDGKFIDVYPNGDYTVYEGNPLNSNLSGNLVAFDAGTGPTNYQGIVQLQLNHNRLGHDSLDLEARARQVEVDLARLTGSENRGAERTTENERTERGVLETAFLGSRVVASEIAESRQQTLQRLRRTDQNTPLTNPLHIDDEVFEAMALGAMDVGEEAIEDIFRIPQMMADMGHLANQLRVELNAALPYIAPSGRELLTNLASNPELRNQFISELTEFLSQPEFRKLFNEALREAMLGEYEEELELARRAFELGDYRVCYFHQGRFITKIILTIVNIISFFAGLASILRNLSGMPGRLMSVVRRMENILATLRRMKSQIPSYRITPSLTIDGGIPYLDIRRRPLRRQQGATPQHTPDERRRRHDDARRRSTSTDVNEILNERAISTRIRRMNRQTIIRLRRNGQNLDRSSFRRNMDRRRQSVRSIRERSDLRGVAYRKEFDRDLFRENTLDRILNDDSHILSFLLDSNTGNFIPSNRYRGQNNITVHMGHIEARGTIHGNRRSRMALQDGWANNRAGILTINNIIDIDGIPVHRETAILWERLGLLPTGTVLRSPISQGFIVPPFRYSNPTL